MSSAFWLLSPQACGRPLASDRCGVTMRSQVGPRPLSEEFGRAWASASRLSLGTQSFAEAMADPANASLVEATLKRRSKNDAWVAYCRAYKEMAVLHQAVQGQVPGPEPTQEKAHMQNWQLVPLSSLSPEPEVAAPAAARSSPSGSRIVSIDWALAAAKCRAAQQQSAAVGHGVCC